MGRIARTWNLAKASAQVLGDHRSLVAVAVVSHLASIASAVAVLFVGLFVVRPDLTGGQAPAPAMWVVLGIASVVGAWVSSFGQGAIVAGAAEHMEGHREPTIRSALATASRDIGRLLTWAVLTVVVARLLDGMRRRAGVLNRLVSFVGGAAFAVVSFLALPVIVFEDKRAIAALKRSAELLRHTWGENVSFNFTFSLLGVALFLPVGGLAWLAVNVGGPPVPTIAVALAAVWLLVVTGVMTALSAVFKTALYRRANDLPVGPTFDERELTAAFDHRQTERV